MQEIVKARIKLIKRQPFFGRLCLQLEPVESELVPTAGVDGEYLYYNPKFIKALGESQLLGVLVHETLHAALGHIWRRNKRDPHRWNIACDYVVNMMVSRNGFDLPANTLLDYKYEDMNAEQVYKKLPKTTTILVCPYANGKGKSKKGKGGSYVFDSYRVGRGRCPCGSTHKMWAKGSKKKYKKELERKWQAAMEEVSKLKGNIPAGFERIIEEYSPKEDWREILANFLSTSMKDFDFMKRDRRSLNSDFYIPDMSDEQQLEDVVVAVDTSGSISQKDLDTFMAEIKNILAVFEDRVKGWVMDCDAEVHKIIPLEEAKLKTSFYGGGGTSHVPVFEEIKKRNLRPKVTICFTDLFTDFPNKAPDYPVLWLLTPDGDYDCKVPFGRIVKMQKGGGE